VRWVTFDCFGTLVDWRSGFSALLEPFAKIETQELLRHYHQVEPILEAQRPHRLYKDVLVEGLLQAAREIGLNLTGEQARVIPQRWGELPVFRDVEPMLDELRHGGFRLGVLTNCDADLFVETERAFRTAFDLVITAEAAGDYKPSLAHFARFRDRANPSAWVHVACSFFHDMIPAERLGIPRIWLDRDDTGEDRSRVSIRVTSAADVPDAIRHLT
jgi:2-haloacid dehalogenase